MEPEADQQVRAGPHRLPEHVDKQEVAGRHEHRHREHEGRDEGEEPRVAGVVVHVADRVDRHEQADAGDDREHDRRERIEPQVDPNRERQGLWKTGGPGGEIISHVERRAGGRHVGVGNARPLPERGHHLDRLGLPVGVPGADSCFTAEAHEERHGRHGPGGDRDDSRPVGPGPEHAAEQNREDRAGQWQGGHEDEERGEVEVGHGWRARAGAGLGAG